MAEVHQSALERYLGHTSRLLRALGPQVSLFAVDLDSVELEPGDDDGEWEGANAAVGDWVLLSGKSLLVLKVLDPFNVYSSVLVDAAESFNAHHGTGTSSFLAWFVLLTEHGLKCKSRGELAEALEMMAALEELFVATIEAVALDMEELLLPDTTLPPPQSSSPPLLPPPVLLLQPASDAEDDTSWFFVGGDGDGEANEMDFIAQVMAQQNKMLEAEATSRAQHECEASATAPLWSQERIAAALQHCLPGDYPLQSRNENSTCLPMHLALQAARPLFFGPCAEAAAWALEQPRNAISVLMVPGCSSDHCQVAVDGLYFRLPNRLLCSQELSPSPTLFQRALCLDLLAFDPGSSGCGGGASDAAKSSSSAFRRLDALDASFSQAQFNPLDPQSLQFSPAALYHSKLMATLYSLGVTLLVVPQDAASEQIVDLCSAHGVTVLPVPAPFLTRAASVVGGAVVCDVLDALEEHCSRHACQVSVLPFGESTTHRLARLCCVQDALVATTRHSSVLLCAPTLAQARAWQDRFWRCVQRLALAHSGAPLVPAGLVEALCVLQLRKKSESLPLPLLLRDASILSELLEKFLAIVASNAFGCDAAQTQLAIHQSVEALADSLLEAEPSLDDDNHNHHSVYSKLKLWNLAPRLMPPPTERSEAQQRAESLDVGPVKAEALRAAVTAAKNVLLATINVL